MCTNNYTRDIERVCTGSHKNQLFNTIKEKQFNLDDCSPLIILNKWCTLDTRLFVVPQFPSFQGHPAHKQAIFYFGVLSRR